MKILGKTGSVVCVLVPAHRRTIFLGRTPYFLSFPALMFKINYEFLPRNQKQRRYRAYGLAVGAVDTENVTEDTIVYPTHFPNILGRYAVCLGIERINSQTLDEMVAKVMHRFWVSRFSVNNKSFFSEWARKTKEDPDWKPKAKKADELGRRELVVMAGSFLGTRPFTYVNL